MDQDPNAPEPEAIKTFHGRGWFNAWGLLLALFVGLLCACAYWIVRVVLGYPVGQEFGWAAMLACFVGVLLLARWTIPDMLLNASKTDARTLHTARGWWVRGWFLVSKRRD
jgi:hypothetical protein